jgi:hypothetical protein
MAQGAVTAAIAGELVDYAAHLGHLLINVDLPGEAKIFAGKLVTGHDGGKRGKAKRSRGVVGRDFVRGIGPLGVAHNGGCGYHQTENPPVLYPVLHGTLFKANCTQLDSIVQKKTARTFCCSCREASDANYFPALRRASAPFLITGIYTRYYRFRKKQIQNMKSL